MKKILQTLALMLLIPTSAMATGYPDYCITARIEGRTYVLNRPVERVFKLYVAATQKNREQGLMNRKKMYPCNLSEEERQQGVVIDETLFPSDGMAFFFPSTSSKKPTFTPQKFWMKNTPLPLDILFMDETGRITFIATAKPHSLTPIGPDTPTANVIEIDAGRAAREGIRVGDKVQYDTQVPLHEIAH